MFLFKKIHIALAILLLATITTEVFSQHRGGPKGISGAQEIVFSNSKWKEVAAQAKKSGKYIFVDAYTSWCGPCKLLKSTTFKDKKAATYFNRNFINFTTDLEKGEGLELAEKWSVTAYPALLFFSPDGKMVLKQIGYVNGEALVAFGKQARARE